MEAARGPLTALPASDMMKMVRGTKELQKLANATWPRVTADQLLKALWARGRVAAVAEGLLDADEVALLSSSGAPPRGALRRSDVPLLDEARWLAEPHPPPPTPPPPPPA